MSILRCAVAADDGHYSSVAVMQEGGGATPVLRSHRIAVGLYNRNGEGRIVRTRRVELDVVGAVTEVPELTGAPVPDLLLLNDDDLTFAKVRFDDRSMHTLLESLRDVEDPLARALCWAQSWDMTRDGELPAREYVGLVARHGPAETEVALLERLILHAGMAIDVYGDPANRVAARAQLAGTARVALHAAEPASDLQLAWARALAANADGADDIEFLRGLLDETHGVAGLAVDTDLRWLIVQQLVAIGHADESLIDVEAGRDPTDIGQRRAAGARASQPHTEAKAVAWRTAAEERGRPLQLLASILGGFEQPGQDELVAPYLERYERAVPEWWSARSTDEAQFLTNGFFPRYRSGPEVLEAADRLLAGPSLPGPARRILAEQRDGTVRSRRAREVDRECGARTN
jgi:aminopeptidase N